MEPLKKVTLEHTYDATAETLWKAWTDPTALKTWWGPDHVSIPECSVDLQVGGTFHIVMKAGAAMGEYQGMLWPMDATYTTIVPHEHLAYKAIAWTEGHKDETMINQTTDITFAEANGKTTITVVAAIYSMGPGAQMAAEGMQYGFTQQLEKLAQFLTGNVPNVVE